MLTLGTLTLSLLMPNNGLVNYLLNMMRCVAAIDGYLACQLFTKTQTP